MSIAIFHNFMDNIGGAEMVTLTLARELKADVYTTNINHEMIKAMGFDDVTIISIGSVPIKAPFKHQFSLYKFRKLDLGKKYDHYIVSGDWAVSGLVNHHPNLWYVHSPLRELYDLHKYVRTTMVPWYGRFIFTIWAAYNRMLVKKYVRSADTIVCNSHNVKQRIAKYLSRDAEIIHPPVDSKKYTEGSCGDYWLSVNRLFPPKRVEIQTEAFRNLPEEKLIIVGSYEKTKHFTEYADHIQKTKPDNVEIRSWVSDDELIDLYENCKGFITTAYNEDFGMTAVEAMAAGKLVIAPNDGGYKESVLHNKTGKLIDVIDSEKLQQVIEDVGSDSEMYQTDCLAQAKKFSTEVFVEKIKKQLYR